MFIDTGISCSLLKQTISIVFLRLCTLHQFPFIFDDAICLNLMEFLFFIIFANLNSRKIRFLLVSIEMRKISWFLTKAEKIFERIPAKGNICFLLSNFLHFNFMTNQHLFTDQFFYRKKERWDRRKKINE